MRATTAITALSAAGRTVAAAESLTGGAVCEALSEAPGSSDVFLGGMVTYSVMAKRDMLGVSGDLLERSGPVDPTVARIMARNVAERAGADIGVATTGVAGPAPHGGHDPGFAYVGWAVGPRDGVIAVQASGDRPEVRDQVTAAALGVVALLADEGVVDLTRLRALLAAPDDSAGNEPEVAEVATGA